MLWVGIGWWTSQTTQGQWHAKGLVIEVEEGRESILFYPSVTATSSGLYVERIGIYIFPLPHHTTGPKPCVLFTDDKQVKRKITIIIIIKFTQSHEDLTIITFLTCSM